MTDLQAKIVALPKYPEREVLPTRKLPYLQTSAPCMICATPLSGDFGLVPAVCEGCYNYALYRYESRRSDAALARLALAHDLAQAGDVRLVRHSEECGHLEGCKPCICGRDALLRAMEVQK